MRITLLGQYPLPNVPSFGGVEVAIVNAQREMSKLDVELHMITCRPEITREQVVEQDGITVTYLPRGRLGRITWHYRDVRQILAALGRHRPDIVHAHGSGFYAMAALSSKLPAVITAHGIFGQEARLLRGWRNRLRGWLDTRYEGGVMRRAQHLIVISPYVEQVFSRTFRGKTYVVENPCAGRFFDLCPQPVPGRVLFSGHVCARKGVLPLLRAFRRLRQEMPQAHLRIAGHTTIEASYYQACRAYVAEAGLEDVVTFLGQLSQDDILKEYAHCAVLVLPSFQETAPVAIEEAMAAAVPVVATQAGGVPWMVQDGKTGLLLPLPPTLDGDPEALAEALLALLCDPARAGEMGRQGRMVANERFRADMVARQTYAVYQQVIAASRGVA